MAREPKVKIGDKIGKLVVIEEIRIPITIQIIDENGKKRKEETGRTKRGWRCKCDCGEMIDIAENTLLKEKTSLRSCGNCPPVKNPNFVPKDMSYEDNEEWKELYKYVEKNIFGYEKPMRLSSTSIMRLKGLTKGKYFAGKKSANNADYSFKVVLATFKYCSPDINKALRTNMFKDEQHKMNYISKIIENNINNVYIRMKNAEKTKEEAKKITVEIPTYTNVEFKPKKKKKDRFSDLW